MDTVHDEKGTKLTIGYLIIVYNIRNLKSVLE